MSVENSKTLRLHIPQWQGGNNHAYHFGAQMLAWLAPKAKGPVEEVDVSFDENRQLENENGIVGRSEIIPQIEQAKAIIAKHQPDNLVILGGDCLVDLAPFAYLQEKYGDDLGILWVDAHPDIMTSNEFEHSHASVLRALMGEGDSDLTQFVNTPIKPNKVMYAGVNDESEFEANFLKERNMRVCRPEEVKSDIISIQKWIEEEQIKVLAIHLDLDVLSISDFGSLLFTNPNVPADAYEGIAQGKLTMSEVLKVIKVASENTKVVGIGVAEHLPWDSLNLKQMLEELPLIGD
ncbi:arginase family protein [Vibrio sp.]|uniref:Arginase family protein n=1 Tax=Vibrio viridaestus TaxID=2487322 RepID=A0A3N9THF6_9VIBR|nr:arginase family protein [Vibrio viridaestus]MDC0610694.1 arginase family protein [Vibrio sp.]RQW63677.1 arginase family protein [Vibrio viridaestus]